MNVEPKIVHLVRGMERTQWTHRPPFYDILDYKILTKDMLRSIKMEALAYVVKTSGSTGEQVTVQKTVDDFIWHQAAGIRDILWRKWNPAGRLAVLKASCVRQCRDSWGLPKRIFPTQGNSYTIGSEPIENIQEWIEHVQPNYLFCLPSVAAQLDLSKVRSLIDVAGTGESGGSMYSCEECGIIALQCPDNPKVMHVMENQLIEITEEGRALVSTLTNPYIRRYDIQDLISFATCHCGRGLQAIYRVKGRTRNLMVLPNGDKVWPTFGSRDMYDMFGIRRHQLIQNEIGRLTFKIMCNPLSEHRELELKRHMLSWLNIPMEITLEYVQDFGSGKFEEFISLVDR